MFHLIFVSQNCYLQHYFQISSYTSDKHYEMTHDVGKEYEDLWNEMWDSEIGKKVWTFDNKTHIYRKVFRVEN